MGAAGTKIKEGCVANRNACGAYVQGYINNGTHPTFPYQRSKLTVCVKLGNVCPPSWCYWTLEIEAINCGSYFVYDLPDVVKFEMGILCSAFCTE